jgi:hypothetical protein
MLSKRGNQTVHWDGLDNHDSNEKVQPARNTQGRSMKNAVF